MTKLQMSVVSAALVAGVSTPIVWQQRTNTRLRDEIAALKQHADDAAMLRAENQRLAHADASELDKLRKEREELNRLRGEVSALRSRTQELAKAEADLRQMQARLRATPPNKAPAENMILAEGLVPALSWNNAGLNTPAASFETWHWAKNRGDIKALASSIVLDANAKPKADALFAVLPEPLRAKFTTPEEMMAGLLANTTVVTGMRVLGQTERGPDDITVHGQCQYADGRVRETDLPLHRYPDGWRQVVPEGLVDKLGPLVRQMAPPQPAGK